MDWQLECRTVTDQSPMSAEALISYLDSLHLETSTVDHPPVFTVEEARRLRGELPGAHSKSLFLRNKKGRMWLVVTLEDRAIDLKDLGERLGGRVSGGCVVRRLRRPSPRRAGGD